MRVAIVAESYLPYVSGVTVSTETLARGLRARGHDVLLVAPRPAAGMAAGTAGAAGRDPSHAWLRSYQLPFGVPPAYRMPWPWRQAAMRHALRFRPEIVHAQSPFVAGELGRRLARRSGAALVFTHHTRFADYRHYLGPFGGPVARLLAGHLRRFWAACDAVVAPAEDLAAEIRALLPTSARTLVRAIPTGVDVAAIRATATLDVRAVAGWEADTVVVATLGRLAREKSVDVLLEAAARARAQVPGLRLAVIGDGPARESLERSARESLGTAAWFPGGLPRGEALALLRGADLFAFASRTETQGLVLAEALACGLAIVALDAPGVRETLRDGVDGRVVAGGTAPATELASAISALAGDAGLRRRLATSAEAGADRFDVAVRIAQVEELYRDLLAR